MASGASDAVSTAPQGFIIFRDKQCWLLKMPFALTIFFNGAQGWIRTSDVSYVPDLQSGAFKATRLTCAFGGSGRIRTHEGLFPACFQDKCHKPDSATLPKVLKQLSALPELRRLEAAVIVVHVFL